MVLTLPRPPADAPASAWQEVVQDGLDALGVLAPRNAFEAMLAIQIIAANAGMLDASRLAFDPDSTAALALRQRACASALGRGIASTARLIMQHRALCRWRRRSTGERRRRTSPRHGRRHRLGQPSRHGPASAPRRSRRPSSNG